MQRNAHFHPGFSLVEVVAVMALLLLIMGLALWGLGGSRARQLTGKVTLDLARIDSAKAAWRADHPQAAFPADEASRFQSLQPYLQVGLQDVTTSPRCSPIRTWPGWSSTP